MTAPRFELDVPVDGTTLHLRLRMLRWEATAWCTPDQDRSPSDCMETRLLDTLDHGEEDEVWDHFDEIIAEPASYLPICQLERDNVDRLLPQGRLFARCPNCGTECELSLGDLATILGPTMPPIFSADGVFLRAPVIASLMNPPARPAGARYASQLRFELPTKRAGYAMGTIEGGVLKTLDEVRYEAAIAEWAARAATVEPTPHWWAPHNKTFRATIKLLVATDVFPAMADSPARFGEMAAVDGYFLDALFWYTHFVDVTDRSTTTCIRCHERFVPASDVPVVAKQLPPPVPASPPKVYDFSAALSATRALVESKADVLPDELRAPLPISLEVSGRSESYLLQLPRWRSIVTLRPETSAWARSTSIAAGLEKALRRSDGKVLYGAMFDALASHPEAVALVLYRRYLLHERLRALGRVFVRCPHCNEQELELALLGMFNHLGVLPPPMFSDDLALFMPPALSRSWLPPERPERFTYATSFRAELPTRRAGFEETGFATCLLHPIDTARERELSARWEIDPLQAPIGQGWLNDGSPIFRATIKMLAGTSDLEPPVDATPTTLGEMAAVDLYFLDAIYWYTHFVDVKEHAPPRTCPRCRGTFMPVARWAYV